MPKHYLGWWLLVERLIKYSRACLACAALVLAGLVAIPAESLAQSSSSDLPRQMSVQGAGSGVTVDVVLKRGRETWGNGGGTPTWEVGLSLANYGAAPAIIGNSTAVFELKEENGEMLGLYIFRDGKTPLAGGKQYEGRYGLTWGAVVGAGELKPWPWGTATGGVSANSAFELVLSAPWASGFDVGGYPTIKAKSRYAYSEKIMAPVGLRSGRDAVIVLPPRIKDGAGRWTQPWFEFRGPVDGGSEASAPTARGVLVASPGLLKPIIADTVAPVWMRVTALSLLAETSYQSALPDLMSILSDEAAPEKLRVAAALNLGVNHHAPAIPEMGWILDSTSSTSLKAFILEALGETEDESAKPIVRAAIQSSDAGLRNVAIDNAAKLKDLDAVDPILAVLNVAKTESDRVIAVEALGKLGSPKAWDSIIAIARDQKADFQARRVAMQAIGDSLYASGESALVEVLANDGNVGMRGNAINSLRKFETETAFTALRTAATTGKDLTPRSAALALAESKLPTWRAAAIEIAADPTSRVASDIIYSLGQRKVSEAVPTLRLILTDKSRDLRLRMSAYSAIQEIAGKPSADDVAALWQMFGGTEDRFQAEEIARKLVSAGFADQSVVSQLVSGMDEERNPAWFANVLLLRHLTKQDIGPKSSYEGTKDSRRAEMDKWRVWATAQPN